MKAATESGPRADPSARWATTPLKARASRSALGSHETSARPAAIIGSESSWPMVRPPKQAEVGVRLTEQLGEPRARRSRSGRRREPARRRRLGGPRRARYDREQHQPLQRGLVELARVARRAAPGKTIAQGTSVDPAPELAVDEVGEPAEEQADRGGAGDRVGDPGSSAPAAANRTPPTTTPSSRRGTTCRPARPRAPRADGEVEVRPVEQDVADAAAEDDARVAQIRKSSTSRAWRQPGPAPASA